MKNYINKVIKVYPKSKKNTFFYILILNLINTLMEVFNIAMIIPLFSVILQKTEQLNKYNIIPEAFFELNHFNQILLMIIIILVIYIVKVFFYIFGHYYLSSKVYQIGADVGNKMVTNYIKAPFEFHIYKTSSYMIRNVYKEANEFIENIVRPGFYLINDIFILSGILFFLLVIDAKKFFVLVIFSFFIFLIFFSIKKIFIIYGSKRQFFDETRLNHLQNILKSIKEIKIYKRENFFFDKFKNDNISNYFYAGRNLFLSNIPRIVIEIVVIISLIIFLLFSIINNSGLKEIDLEVSMLFLAALVRFVPLVSRINQSINSMRYGQATLELIHDELNNFNSGLFEIENNSKYEMKNSIKFKDVNFKFSNSKKNLFNKDLNFEINKGDLVKIIGQSGSGKTTLSHLLIGFLTPSSGKILIDNISNNKILNKSILNIGLVSQNIYLFNDTIKNNIVFGNKSIEEKKLIYALDAVNLSSKETFSLNSYISENGKNLSGGEIQRVAIARAIYNDAELIIFDEPTSNLDNENSLLIEKLIKSLRKNKTIVVISHDNKLFQDAELTIKLDL